MNAAKVEQEINSYMQSLNLKQKKDVLTHIKGLIEPKDDSGYSDEFKKELDSRYEEYINGGELFTREEVNKEIQEIIKGKRKK
jgi:hypothetical protein